MGNEVQRGTPAGTIGLSDRPGVRALIFKTLEALNSG